MTKNVLTALFSAARGLLKNPLALVVILALYLALIAACFFFVTTREATAWQVALTALTALAAPLLFFIVQAASASYAVGERTPSALIKRTARSFLKLFALSLPLIALVVLSVFLLNKLANRVTLSPAELERTRIEAGTQADDDASSADSSTDSSDAPAKKPPVRWGYLAVSALRLMILGFVLPLIAIHLWLAAARDGLLAAITRSPRLIARALSARAVLTYAVGMVVFALIPYFLITKRTPVASNTFELLVFGARMLMAFALMLFGWVMTMTALAHDEATAATTLTGTQEVSAAPPAGTVATAS